MRTILFFILILIISPLNAQWDEPYKLRDAYEKERLFIKDKRIRKFIDYEYKTDTDGKLGDVKNFRIVKYDDRGNLICSIEYDRQKKVKSYIYNVYNKNNEKTHLYLVENDDLIYKTTFYYDLKNKLVESVKKTKFGSVDTKKRYYYKGDQIKRIEAKGPSDKLICIERPEYNPAGDVIRADSENNNEVLTEIRTEYKNGHISNTVFKDFDKEIILSKEYIYKNDLPDTIKLEQGVENETFEVEKTVIKRLYKTYDEEESEFEKAFKLPDFKKYVKTSTGYHPNYTYVTPPQFPGGKDALIKYIDENLKYPKNH